MSSLELIISLFGGVAFVLAYCEFQERLMKRKNAPLRRCRCCRMMVPKVRYHYALVWLLRLHDGWWW